MLIALSDHNFGSSDVKGYLGWYQDGPELLNIEGIGNIMDVGTPHVPAHNPKQGEFYVRKAS